MPFRSSVLAFLLVFLGSSGCVFFVSPPDTSIKTRAEAEAALAPLTDAKVASWQEADRIIASALAKTHPNPWFRLSEAEFKHEIAALERDLPRLTERQVLLRWKLIFARLGDEHTSLWEEAAYTQRWPIRIQVVPAGVFITDTDQGLRDLLGARILKVGNQSVEAFLKALDAFFPAAVSSHRSSREAAIFPYGWIWLKDLGRLPQDARPTIEVVKADGQSETRSLPILNRWNLHWATLKPPVQLLREADPQRFYTHALIEAGHSVYIRYRVCRNQPGQESVWAFTGRVQRETGKAPVERAIIDLRGNGGGNSLLFWRMERWLRKHPMFSRPGGLLVLTDSRTFSSGFMAAWNLQQAGGRVLGSEPGQPLNAYGQIRFTLLPGLGPVFACSSKAFCYMPDDPSAWHRSLRVDVPVTETREDALGMTDSVLTAALSTPLPNH